MGKRLDITPKIADAIARSTDSSVDPATVAVYEAAALNTLPLNKKGTLFDKATVSENTLMQMADFLNSGTNYAPLHVLHDQGYALPEGRVFAGDVIQNDAGIPELRVLFYIPLNGSQEAQDLIAKLDSATIDEVSVGLKTQHINCSECGFDYLGPDATFSNIWNLTCNNDHTIGVNGVHTLLSGLDKFLELSLVSRGAAQNTKIMSRAKSLLGADLYNSLAASGHVPEATLLFASPTKPKPINKEPSMDTTKLVDDLTTAKASILVAEGKLTAAQTTIEAQTAEIKTLKEQVTALSANADAKKVEELTAQLSTVQTSEKTALAFIRAEADRLAVAAGQAKLAEDANFEALVASIETNRTKLRETLPTNGRSLEANGGSGEAAVLDASPKSFKTR